MAGTASAVLRLVTLAPGPHGVQDGLEAAPQVGQAVLRLADSIIQANIASEYRATILSVVSMLQSLMSAVSYSALGGILDRTGTTGLMLFLALVSFAALGCFRLILTYR